jgi:(p)ppGpp synthase/HD superfamily hydrolase
MNAPCKPPLHSIADERRSRFASLRDHGAREPALFETSLVESIQGPERRRIDDAYANAKAIQYGHAGLDSSTYFAHPLRVAQMILRLIRPADVDAVVIGLLHNVLEVTSIPLADIRGRFGETVADALVVLTVDRSRVDAAYKESYYARMQAASRSVRIVKILDKLDNLFTLCLNPDGVVRAHYLEEIERYIVPMAEIEIPAIVDYLMNLIRDCRRTGFCPPEAILDGGAESRKRVN